MADHTLTAASPTSSAVDHPGGAATIHIYDEFDGGGVIIEAATDGGTVYTALTTERGFKARYKESAILNIDLRPCKLRFRGDLLGDEASIKVDYASVF